MFVDVPENGGGREDPHEQWVGSPLPGHPRIAWGQHPWRLSGLFLIRLGGTLYGRGHVSSHVRHWCPPKLLIPKKD